MKALRTDDHLEPGYRRTMTDFVNWPTLTAVDDTVFVLNMGDGENRLTPEWVALFTAHLDTIEAHGRPTAVVTTGTGKFFSNGLDLDGLLAEPATADGHVEKMQALLARLLISPVPTVAAIQGHAFAAGAMLALAHDHRIMRADRGFWCLPEVDIDIPFTPGMCELITAKLGEPIAHRAMTTGHRYTAVEALGAGIVEHTTDAGALLDHATAVATADAKRAGATLQSIKRGIYGRAWAALRDSPAHLDATNYTRRGTEA
jgi:Delta3-Delta2-enoyl-CoA isomerase